MDSRLGKSRAAPTYKAVQTTYLDPQHKPLATYTFKYMSRASLQPIGLVARPIQATPLEDRPIETLSRQQMRDLHVRQREREATMTELKRKIKMKSRMTIRTV